MSRPLRIEFPGAVYHVNSRGDRRGPIFEDDEDRHNFLVLVSQAMERFDATVLAYCLMDNHYHFVIHTRQANLSRLMRQLNGVHTQMYNRRQRRSAGKPIQHYLDRNKSRNTGHKPASNHPWRNMPIRNAASDGIVTTVL